MQHRATIPRLARRRRLTSHTLGRPCPSAAIWRPARATSPRRSSRGSSSAGWTRGLFHPEPAGDGERELLDRDPAAERHRLAAHGPRAQRLDPGRADPLPPHARPAHEVDLRHRPRRHRHADAGRAARSRRRARAARSSGARRSSSASGSGASSTARTIIEQFKRLGASLRLRGRALHARRRLRRARCMKVFVDLYEKGYIYRDHYMVNWDPGSALGDLRPRGRGARGRRHALLRSTTRSSGGGEVTVATVRPETMLADTAVAVNPDDERYRDLVGAHGDPAAGRAAAADHRRRVRRSPTSAPAR